MLWVTSESHGARVFRPSVNDALLEGYQCLSRVAAHSVDHGEIVVRGGASR